MKSCPSGLVFVRRSRICSTAAKGTPETLAIASLDAEDFIENPTVETYLGLKKSAKKARVWSEIEKGMMRYLEQGVLPYPGGAWPLKQTGLKTHPYSCKKNFPPTHTLIDIAIEEKRPDDVIRWYDQRKVASHLRKAQRVIKELDKEKEWQEYLSALRKANERKRRCIEILDGLQGRRIIEGH